MKLKSAIYTVLLSGLLLPLMLNCKKEIMKTPPLLTISAITNITPTTANCGGDITSGGGAGITEHGVCWSAIQNPIILDNKTLN